MLIPSGQKSSVLDMTQPVTKSSDVSERRLQDSEFQILSFQTMVPQFVSQEFEEFCRNNGIRHTTSSAYHPNGEAERFIKTFKSAMKKEKGIMCHYVRFCYRIGSLLMPQPEFPQPSYC